MDSLQEALIRELMNVVSESVESMFFRDVSEIGEIRACRKPDAAQDLLAWISLSGPECQGQIVISMSASTAEKLLHNIMPEAEISSELLVSSIGELANLIGCSYVISDSVVAVCGRMEISPPMTWDLRNGLKPHFLPSRGAAGTLDAGGGISCFVGIDRRAPASEVVADVPADLDMEAALKKLLGG
ncbi:MAG: hypothetical protein RL095_1580 [Verrucomicrobiota bacterium]|jgi:CheY-specific phosphatase CheX